MVLQSPTMDLTEIVQQLRAERNRLDAAIKALTSVAGTNSRGIRKRIVSMAARKRMAAAQRARWAKQNSSARTARPKRTMSAAARRKIAAAQRARWAKVKAARR